MSLFKVNKKEAAKAPTGGSSFIGSSGIYDVSIVFASLDTSKNGAESVNFNLMYNGKPTTIFGPYVTTTKGKPVDFSVTMINNLLVVAGMEDGEEPVIEEQDHKVGKDGVEKTFVVIDDLSDVDVKIWVQEEYSINPRTDAIQKRLAVRGFYREDGASAAEVVNETEVGAQLAKDMEYAANITYKDDLTAEDVAAWKASKKDGGSDTPVAKTTAKKPTKSLFK